MSDKTKNLLKSAFFFFIAIFCYSIKVIGGEDVQAGSFVYIGTLLGLFLGIAFLRRAFDK